MPGRTTDQPALKPAEIPFSPFSLGSGRYLVTSCVATGGTASVHIAYDKMEHTWRAVKVLRDDLAEHKAVRRRFEIEARAMTTLDHPHVLQVFATGVDDGKHWMVMEQAEGGAIDQWLERHGPMPPRLAVQVILNVCDALSAAHLAGMVHRDVKPGNILITKEGICKLADFGIAYVYAADAARVTQAGSAIGTLGFMAPEQQEDSTRVDQRSDVYAAAATLYALVNGVPHAHLFMADEEDYQGLPPALVSVIRVGAAYQRDQRYQRIVDLADALRGIQDELGPIPADTPVLSMYEPPRTREEEAPTEEGAPRRERSGSLDAAEDTAGFGTVSRTWSEDVVAAKNARRVLPRNRLVQKPPDEPTPRTWVRPLLIGLGSLLLVLTIGATAVGGVALIGRANVQVVDAEASQRHEALVAALLEERLVAEEVASVGVSAAQIEALYDKLEGAEPETQRQLTGPLADTIEEAVRVAGRKARPAQLSAVRAAEQRAKRITQVRGQYQQAAITADEVRSTSAALLALQLGLVD